MEQFKKSYKIPLDIYSESYKVYQNKYVDPKNRLYIVVAFIFTANFAYGAVKRPGELIAYLGMVLCFAAGLVRIFNPINARRRVIDTVREMGDVTYSVTVGDDFVEFATESIVEVVDADETPTELPEPTRLPLDDKIKVTEHERFFLLIYGKEVFYTLPKAEFSPAEQEILRNIGKN